MNDMEDVRRPIDLNSPRFMDQLRVCIRSKNLAYKTEKTYCRWVTHFIRYHNNRHPREMGSTEVNLFLSYLSVERNMVVNSQKTALNALVFLYKQFLHILFNQHNLLSMNLSTCNKSYKINTTCKI